MKTTRTAGICLGLLLAGTAAAQQAAPKKGAVIALVAAIGDQLTIVKQRQSTGSSVEPFQRTAMQIDGLALNFAVLRGLDDALALEEPDSRRVLLRWRAPEATAEQISKAGQQDRNDLLLDALREHLRQVPQRAEWDRIEAVVPRYIWQSKDGMARRLSGIGIYVQPLSAGTAEIDQDTGEVTITDEKGERKTVNPNTGEHGKESTFVAPYMYFDRVTLDARTLDVIARKTQYTNTKYNDPMSTAIDVAGQLNARDTLKRLATLVERAAFQSVRGKVEVEVGPVRQLPAAPTPAK